MTSIHDFAARSLAGEELPLARFGGQVLLVVNTASQCGFTPQYEGLEQLYRRYRERGFAVLGFPCNQFGKQEPGSAGEIAEFCRDAYQVTFPLFAKVDVNGAGTHPLFAWLKSAAPGLLGTRRVKWNFTKFLVGRDGRVVRRFAPLTKPEKLHRPIEGQLDRA